MPFGNRNCPARNCPSSPKGLDETRAWHSVLYIIGIADEIDLGLTRWQMRILSLLWQTRNSANQKIGGRQTERAHGQNGMHSQVKARWNRNNSSKPTANTPYTCLFCYPQHSQPALDHCLRSLAHGDNRHAEPSVGALQHQLLVSPGLEVVAHGPNKNEPSYNHHDVCHPVAT